MKSPFPSIQITVKHIHIRVYIRMLASYVQHRIIINNNKGELALPILIITPQTNISGVAAALDDRII